MDKGIIMKQIKKSTINEKALLLHRKHQGKLEIKLKTPIESKEDLAVLYSPGVAAPCLEIYQNPKTVSDYTWKQRTIAVVSDGSAVLGLGNIGAAASLPVMEGKCALFKRFANIDAVPIVLDTQDVNEIVETIAHIAPGFGGINLEDISAPRCVQIEQLLQEKCDIPVFHDDQHGTAIVVLAGLINALRLIGKKAETLKVVVSGAGAAGSAIIRLLVEYGIKNIYAFNIEGIIHQGLKTNDPVTQMLMGITNLDNKTGTLAELMQGADVFIGVSAPNIIDEAMIRAMNADPIVFALANPNPEISYERAKAAQAAVVATGRSDYPNQINNVLVFPGLFRGLLDAHAKRMPHGVKIKVAQALAGLISDQALTAENIIPDVFHERVVDVIASVVKKTVLKE